MNELLSTIPLKTITSDECRTIFDTHRDSIVVGTTRTLQAGLLDAQRIVLVHQMGKVASKTFENTLITNPGLLVLHSHRMEPKQSQYMLDYYLQINQPRYALREIYWQSIYQFIHTHNVPIYLISAMRDPIARNISAYFQNLHMTEPKCDDLIKHFFKTYPHNVPLEWFDRELVQAFGIDVFFQKFNKSRGWDILQQNNIHCLIVTAEADDREKIHALHEFLDIDCNSLLHANIGAKKDYASIYQKFTSTVKFPESYIKKMLGSRLTKHFYTKKQINTFKQRWRN